jgi:transcription-repair coupling factor (superfamily II helicase)
MDKIQNYLSNTSFFGNVIDKYNTSDEIHLTNTNDSISLFTVLNLFDNVDHSILIVTPNVFKAQKIFEKLSNILDSSSLGFFPQDEFLTTEMLAMSNEFKLERINTIKKIINKNKMIVVTNTTGLIKYLQPKKSWEKAIIRLRKNDTVDFEALFSKLISLGYQREETIDKQGEFSFRGGLLDIYPLNEINPIRIEFFDDEVETIRYFDISTQRSTIKTKQIEIFPMFEFHYTQKQYEEINLHAQNKLNEIDFDEKSLNRKS